MSERTNPHADIVVGAQDQASPVFDKIKGSAQGMATGVEQSAKKAGDAVAGMGAKADEVAKATERATSSVKAAVTRMVSLQQRALVEAQGFSLQSAEGLEALARLRNADVSAIQGQLDALRGLRREQENLAAAQRDAAQSSSFERELAAADAMRRRADATYALTQALDVQEAKEREIAALGNFNQQLAAAESARRRADATFALTQALDVQEARERELAALPSFERERAAAEQARRRADATAALTQALDQQEAAERNLASQNGFLTSLKGQSDAIGKTRADLLEMQAAQMGLTTQAAPYIAKLRESEVALARGGSAMNQYGQSAKQTAAALRGVPAQITDIFVSLQGGQAPLTVLLQQGGQLKDMFGGITPAAKALGGAVLGMVNPFTLVAAAIGVIGLAYYQGSKEADAYRLALVSTGNATGTTVGQLNQMASAIDGVVGTQAKAAETLALFATQTVAGSRSLQEYAQAAIAWERVSGESVDSVAKKFGSLKDDPLKGVLKLNESMNFLTDSVYQNIKSLEEQGKTTDAAKVAQDALASALNERTGEMVKNLGSIERAWIAIKDVVSETWDAIKSVGRDAGPEGRVVAQRQAVANLEALAARGGTKPETAGFKAKLQVAREALAVAESEAALNALNATIDAERTTSVKARAAADASAVKYLGEQEKITRQIAKESEEIRRAYIGKTSPEDQSALMRELAEREKQIRASYAKNVRESAGVGQNEVAALRAQADAAEKYLQQLRATGSEVEKLTAGEQRAAKIREELKTSITGTARAQKELALVEAERLGRAERATVEQKDLIKSIDESEKAYRKYLDGLQKSSDAIGQRADQQEAANAAHGKSKTAIEELTLAQMNLALATEKDAGPWSPEAIAKMEEAIKQQERWVKSLQGGDLKTLNARTDELLRSAQEMGALYEDEMRLTGLSSLEREKLVALRQVELKYAKELAAVDKMASDTDEQRAAKDAQRTKVLQAKQIESSAVVAKVVESDWAKTAETISSTLQDYIMGGGKNAAEYIKRLFSTLVLRPVISAVMAPISGGIQGMMGGMAGGGGGGSGIMGGIQTASNLNTLWGAGSQALYGGAAGASAASLGYANLVGMAGGDAIGALATANGMWAGVATGAQGAAQAAIAANVALEAGTATALASGTTATAAGGTAAAGAGGISGALAAIPVWGWALAAVAVLGTMLSKKQTLHSGAGAIYNSDTGVQEGAGIYNLGTFGMGDVREYNKDGQALASGIAAGLGSTLDGVAKAFGQKAGYEVATAFADDTSKDGAWGSLIIKQMGDAVLDWRDTQTSKWAPKEFADGEAGQKEYLAAIAKDTRTVLLDMDLPSWADTMIESIGEAASMDQLAATVQQIGVIQSTFVQLGKTMEGFAGLTDQAFEALMRASGGFEALSANAATYYENFYSDAEKTAAVTRSVSESLAQVGLAMPATRDEFRALVESQLAMGESGAESAAALLGVSGAFASITEALPSATAATKDNTAAIDDGTRAAEDALKAWQDLTDSLLGDRASAEIDLLRAQGKEEEALAAERARAIVGYDAYQVSLYDGTQAIFRQIEALELQIEAIDKATEAREREAESVANLFSALDSSASRFLSGDALSGFQSTRQSDQLRGLGFDVSASQILGATTDQVKAFTLAVLGMDSVSNDAKTALLQLAGSILDTKESAQQTAQQDALKGVDTAFATLQRSVSLQRGVLSETATELKSVFDLLKTNVRDLYGEVDGAAQAQAAKARDFITKAVGAARTTGYLPDSQALQDAIGSARSGLDATVYASQAEADFQRLVLANELRDLQDISGDQLTEAEKQIKALDDILENAQTQVDALRGIDQSVLTVSAAIAALGVSISAALGAGVKPAPGGTITAPSSKLEYSNSAVMAASGYVQSAVAAGDLMGIYQGAKANGLNSADTAYLLQLSGFDVSKEDVLAWVTSQGLPSFAVGTNYVPKDMLAQVHKGEMIVPAAYNPAASGMSNNTARLEALIEKLTQKVELLETAANTTAVNTGRSAEVLTSVNNGNSLVTAAAPIF